MVLPELLVTGINPNQLAFSENIVLDSLKFSDVNLKVNLRGEANKETTEKESSFSPKINIKHLIIQDHGERHARQS